MCLHIDKFSLFFFNIKREKYILKILYMKVRVYEEFVCFHSLWTMRKSEIKSGSYLLRSFNEIIVTMV